MCDVIISYNERKCKYKAIQWFIAISILSVEYRTVLEHYVGMY